MPPKRRRNKPAAEDTLENVVSTTRSVSPAEEDHWTDDQEAALLKSMILWKPVGMHKHFRVIAISEHLRDSGYNSDADAHVRPEGIWKKLRSLYELEALDEIENSTSLNVRRNERPEHEPFCDFELPHEEYWEKLFARRLAPERSSSPPALPYQLRHEGGTRGKRQSTIEDTDEPRSSPASNRGGRAGRNRGRRGSHHPVNADQRGRKASLDESTEEGDTMDVDGEGTPKTSKTSAVKSARRSGRIR